MGFPDGDKLELGVDLLTALQVILGFLQLLDTIHFPLLETIDRGTTLNIFELGVDLTIPLLLVSVFWLGYHVWKRSRVTLLVFVSTIVYVFFGLAYSLIVLSLLGTVCTLWLRRRFSNFVSSLLLLLSVVEAAALVDWAILLPLGIQSPLGKLTEIEFAFFSSSDYIVPILAMLLLFSWLFRPLLDFGLNRKILHDFKSPRIKLDARSMVVLFLAVLISIEAAFYPYFSGINPGNVDVGVDIPQYVKAVTEANGDISKILVTGNGTRALALLMIMGIHELTGSDLTLIVRYLPALLNPLLVVAFFLFSYQIFQNARIAEWSAFLGACSSKIVVGMYSHFIANLLALIIILTSLALLYRSQRKNSLPSLYASLFVGSLFVFVHPWTFMQYLGAMGVALAVFYLLGRRQLAEEYDIKNLVVYTCVLIGSEIIKDLLMPQSGGVGALNTLLNGITLLPDFWVQSIFSFQFLYGGYLSSALLYVLCLVGVYFLAFKRFPETQLWALLLVSSIVYLFGDDSIKGRLLFNIPLCVLEACGLTILLQRYEKIRHSIVLFTVLSSLVYLFRSLANFVA